MKSFSTYIFLLVIFFCSCKKNDTTTREVSVCPVPLHDYDSLTFIRDEHPDSLFRLDVDVRTRIDIELQNAAANKSWDGSWTDWDANLAVGLYVKDIHATLNIVDYFIIYHYLPSTDPNEVVIQADIVTGHPFDSSKAPIKSFTASGKIGDPYPGIPGDFATDRSGAAEVAAKALVDKILASGVIDKIPD